MLAVIDMACWVAAVGDADAKRRIAVRCVAY